MFYRGVSRKIKWYLFLLLFCLLLFSHVTILADAESCNAVECSNHDDAVNGIHYGKIKGTKCPSVADTSCKGGTCWADSAEPNGYCDGHILKKDNDNSTTEILGTTYGAVVSRSAVMNGNQAMVSESISYDATNTIATKTTIKYYNVTYDVSVQTSTISILDCIVDGCELKFKTDTTTTTKETRNVIEKVTTTSVAIRCIVNEYEQKVDGSFPDKPTNTIIGDIGAYKNKTENTETYNTTDVTQLTEDLKIHELSNESHVQDFTSSSVEFTGWSRDITDTHYASDNHKAKSYREKIDTNIEAKTITYGDEKVWNRYLYRKRYYVDLYPNIPTNASTTLSYMKPKGYEKKDGVYRNKTDFYVGASVSLPKTADTYQLMGYASRNKWYKDAACTDNAPFVENTKKKLVTALKGYGEPSKLYVLPLYVEWISEPGSLFLMPNSGAWNGSTDSGYGAYLEDNNHTNHFIEYNSSNILYSDSISQPTQ